METEQQARTTRTGTVKKDQVLRIESSVSPHQYGNQIAQVIPVPYVVPPLYLYSWVRLSGRGVSPPPSLTLAITVVPVVDSSVAPVRRIDHMYRRISI